jgi:hypothetical protein
VIEQSEDDGISRGARITMRAFFRGRWLAAVAAGMVCAAAGLDRPAMAWQDIGDSDPPGPEVLNRGPIHEAFANPIVYDPTPGPVVPTQPPDPIEEQPPDMKPEGDNVQWIPGYWAWDDERTDFIWVSGIWRVPPPNCQWTPGYWNQCDDGNGGWRWTCGCWTPVDLNNGQYLPAPPPSIEQGPNGPPPTGDGNCIWNPGYWSWTDATAGGAARYVWRAGCWTPYNPNWLWMPPRYVSTAGGYLFLPGYWDYPIERRGILFAPIYCGRRLRPLFAYRPSVCISTASMISCLFVRPRFHSYCFGDYFDAGHSARGIYPCYAYHRSRYGCDPIYAHCAAGHFGDPGWSRRLFDEYRYRRENPAARPPRIYNESLMARYQSAGRGRFSNLNLTMPVHRLSEHQHLPSPIAPVHASQRQGLVQSAQQLHQLASHRRTEELKAAGSPQRGLSQPTHVNLPRSPIASRTALDRGSTVPHGPSSPARHAAAPTAQHVPPPHPSYPQPDHRVQSPGAHYTPNRPEPHHDLPPPEHRTPSHAQYGSPAGSSGHSQPHAVNQVGASSRSSGTARHR